MRSENSAAFALRDLRAAESERQSEEVRRQLESELAELRRQLTAARAQLGDERRRLEEALARPPVVVESTREIVVERPATAQPAPEVIIRREPPNHMLTFVLAFLAVVGIGAAATLSILPPPGRQKIITVERPVDRVVEKIVRVPVPAPIATPPVPSHHGERPRPVSHPSSSAPMIDSSKCGNDPLCGIDERKQ